MPQTSLYYRLKPFLPWHFRIFSRRLVAQYRQRSRRDIWPINEVAGQTPAGWPGWPHGKKFAFVLTHDVEGFRGLAKSLPLMNLEKPLGFVSSFNFIPEGDYRLSRELREELVKNGFEVGVHDLHHDGKLYDRRENFARKADEINRYLREWGASGFRSGFMHHDLEWAHDLNIKYDASTFDTDPFEPQPDAANTIFPFWVSGPNGRGYVELPYTLPQDFTLFVVFREESTKIWRKKLKWLVEKGGMALMDVHPDYLNFGDEPVKASEFPAAWYRDFLEFVRTEYAGQYWNPLPKDLADWYAKTCAPKNAEKSVRVNGADLGVTAGVPSIPKPAFNTSPPKRICMITHSIYESDNRVLRYANSLAERGDEVDVLALKRDPTLANEETVGKVRLHRLQFRSRKNQNNRGAYLLPLLRFWFISSFVLSRKHLFKSYDLIHVHNVPDFLVFAAWLPRLTGAKIILDIHDMVPEFYASKFQVESGALVI